jgi:putative transposase
MTIRPADPAPRGARWIDVAQAAARLGISERNVRLRCGEQWFPVGLAKMLKPAAGGKPCWHVREDADPQLGRVLFPDQIPFDLRTLKSKHREALLKRKNILDEWEKARAVYVADGKTEREAMEGFLRRMELEGIDGVSRPTLLRWGVAFRTDGLKGLADARWRTSAVAGSKVGEAISGGDPFLEQLKAFWLTLNRPSKRRAWEAAKEKAAQNGWAVKEYRTASRYLAQIPKAVALKFREGERAYVAKAEPSITRDYSTLHSNEMWVGDHHQFDVIVSHKGKLVRPWLTAWEDMRSRKIVGWCVYAHDPNQNTVLSAFRGGCLTHGVPDSMYIDNGKDFDAYALHGRTKWERRRVHVEVDKGRVRGLLNHLGCDVIHAWPYHGQSKPIERFFGTVEDRFGKNWPTYCGRNPENKPENLPARLERGAAPELEEFIERFGQWLTGDYHASGHTGDAMNGQTPEAVYASSWNGASRRTTSPEAMDLLLMKQTQPLKVSKNGVRWNGLGYGQNSQELFTLLGKDVYLRVDERDVTNVLIFSTEDQFICVAPANRRLPANASEQQLREAIKEKKQHRKLATEYHDKRLKIHNDLPELMTAAAARQHAEDQQHTTPPTPDGPASIRPIHSPLTSAQALKRIAQGMKRPVMRTAVGAEAQSMSFAELGSVFAPDKEPEPNTFQTAWDTLSGVFGPRRESSEEP